MARTEQGDGAYHAQDVASFQIPSIGAPLQEPVRRFRPVLRSNRQRLRRRLGQHQGIRAQSLQPLTTIKTNPPKKPDFYHKNQNKRAEYPTQKKKVRTVRYHDTDEIGGGSRRGADFAEDGNDKVVGEAVKQVGHVLSDALRGHLLAARVRSSSSCREPSPPLPTPLLLLHRPPLALALRHAVAEAPSRPHESHKSFSVRDDESRGRGRGEGKVGGTDGWMDGCSEIRLPSVYI